MSLHDELAPGDDAFIRTAIRGLRAPEHHPAFWEELTRELDMAEEVLVAQGVLVAPAEPPLVVQLPVERVEPVPEPLLPPAPHPPRREPLRAVPPAHAAPGGGERIRAFGNGAPAVPKPSLVVRHDPAVVPLTLRRSSNAVLLAVAVVAGIVALVAGLTLVRQRSDAGGAPPAEQPAAAAETGWETAFEGPV